MVPGQSNAVTRNLAVTPPLQTIHGPVAGAGLGASLAAAGDVDGDGRIDMLAGSPGETSAAGAAYLVRGAPNTISDLALASSKIAPGRRGRDDGQHSRRRLRARRSRLGLARVRARRERWRRLVPDRRQRHPDPAASAQPADAACAAARSADAAQSAAGTADASESAADAARSARHASGTARHASGTARDSAGAACDASGSARRPRRLRPPRLPPRPPRLRHRLRPRRHRPPRLRHRPPPHRRPQLPLCPVRKPPPRYRWVKGKRVRIPPAPCRPRPGQTAANARLTTLAKGKLSAKAKAQAQGTGQSKGQGEGEGHRRGESKGQEDGSNVRRGLLARAAHGDRPDSGRSSASACSRARIGIGALPTSTLPRLRR